MGWCVLSAVCAFCHGSRAGLEPQLMALLQACVKNSFTTAVQLQTRRKIFPFSFRKHWNKNI